jgi:serine O-acetyltransferase
VTTATYLQEGVADIADALVASYSETTLTSNLGHPPLPRREAIAEILADLTHLLYPGFACWHKLEIGNSNEHVGKVLEGLRGKLTQEIGRALRHNWKPDTPVIDLELVAEEKAIGLLRLLPRLRQVLEQDVRAAYEGDPAATSYHEIIYCYPGLGAVTIYRLAHELLLLGVPLIPRMMTELAHSRTGIDIHPGARIGPSFFIDHGTGVVIGETSEIGSKVRLYQGVTLIVLHNFSPVARAECAPGGGEVPHPLQTDPRCLRSGRAIVFAIQVAA